MEWTKHKQIRQNFSLEISTEYNNEQFDINVTQDWGGHLNGKLVLERP